MNEISEAEELRQVVFSLIEEYEARDQTPELLAAAQASSPTNSLLMEVALKLDLASISASGFEAMVQPALKLLDVNTWRERLGILETQVCAITVESDTGKTHGTGCLLGPDVVLTNYHVIDAVIEAERGRANRSGQRAGRDDVSFTFDYKRDRNKVICPGKNCRLAADWLIAYSPTSPGETRSGRPTVLPALDELDYALLRLNRPLGSEPVGLNPDPRDRPRGWMVVPHRQYSFTPTFALAILQHPYNAPLKLSFNTDSQISYNANFTRVTYKTNTGIGSSGAPCFDIDWNPVALHHWGDPSLPPAYNQGIPFHAIYTHLERLGKLDEVWQTPPEFED